MLTCAATQDTAVIWEPELSPINGSLIDPQYH